MIENRKRYSDDLSFKILLKVVLLDVILFINLAQNG